MILIADNQGNGGTWNLVITSDSPGNTQCVLTEGGNFDETLYLFTNSNSQGCAFLGSHEADKQRYVLSHRDHGVESRPTKRHVQDYSTRRLIDGRPCCCGLNNFEDQWGSV